MSRSTGRITLIASALCATIAIAAIVARGQAPAVQGAASAAPKAASQQFKNMQILKDDPADQIIPAMQFISASLGVDCEFCHVEHAFDKDDKKPKVTARKMMEMMMNINKENFDGHRVVTCNTCHQGVQHPINIPVISADAKAPVMEHSEMSATGNPGAESLLDKYLAAVGGADALKKVTSRTVKGTVTAFGDQHMPIEIFAKAPDQRISVMRMKDGESVTAYNGKVGWLSVPGRVHMMNGQESFGAKMDADFGFAANVKSLYPKWKTLPGEKIDGQDTWLVLGSKDGEPPLRLYFDQKSGLLVRLVRYIDSPLGYNPTEVDYADYRVMDGVKTPFKWTVARPGNRFTVQVDEMKQNVPVDDAKFVVPPSPLPPPAH